MMQPRPLQCVFYSHVWGSHMLKHAGMGNFDNTVLAELAVESNLAAVFGQQKSQRYGLAGLLVVPDSLEKLAAEFKNIPAPLVLASNPAVPATTLEDAVSLLPTAAGPFQKATLLVHIKDAPQFAEAYHYVDQFSILWDIADFPSSTLAALATVLADNYCLSPERWRGFHLCSHPRRPVADAPARRAALQSVLDDFPQVAQVA